MLDPAEGDDMNRETAHPRRLRVSALAAVANPSYTRVDTWNLLDDACRHLAEVNLAGLDIAHDVARVKRLMARIGAYEDELHAAVTVNSRALAEADALDKERAAGHVRAVDEHGGAEGNVSSGGS